MKILFVTFSPLAFDVQTPEREPLGGTESCICYLARQLAANGHDVTVIANQPPGTQERILGVRHWPQEALDNTQRIAGEDFEAAISISNPMVPTYLRGIAPRTLNFAWMHTYPDDAVIASLNKAANDIDGAVFVSESLREAYRYQGAAHVIVKAIAPAFENLFGSAAELRAAKQNRAVYTSMPFPRLGPSGRGDGAFGRHRTGYLFGDAHLSGGRWPVPPCMTAPGSIHGCIITRPSPNPSWHNG